ncbi:SMC family ATPase [Sporosarcina sp. PTS2304]|uniref:AAA family ATPase n=1 Tax=Sporosarcina sp. PTS2304 TaxID=2283194 RepID=UPI000E0D6AC1|nr:SMC family ATPase [Sporosarcina sp. PTS2304]AXH99513.1 SMC family ATPase [Sporosarcina sp. PTS2304]
MKPIQLTMTAFGPYKDTEVVDFRDLKEHRLFVISGKTGAGKTTIFDGICFALYGQASGEDRTDTKALRSQFADDAVQSTVELIFDIHQRRFHVLRQIPYRKQGNKSDTLGRCELYEMKEGQSIPVVDRQIVTEVNEKIEQLLGFTHAQFSQIMMLPQGEFRKFLTSDTTNKEAIMRKIFKTEPYQKLVERLKGKKEEAYSAYIQEKQMSDTILHQIPAKLPKRESILFNELTSEYPNYNQIMLGLHEEHLHYTQQSAECHKEYATLYKLHDVKQKELYSARYSNEQCKALATRQQELTQLEEQAEEMRLFKQQLQAAERAAMLEDLEQQVQTNTVELKHKENSYKEAVEMLTTANQKLAEITVNHSEQQAKERERTVIKEELTQLKSFLPTVSGLTLQLQEIEGLHKNVKQIDSQLQRVLQEIEKQQNIITSQKNEINELESTLEEYEYFVDQLSAVTDIAKRVKHYHYQQSVFNEVDEQYKTATSEYERSTVTYEKLESLWLSNQAELLASSLHAGEACPVCGSQEHPAKAVQTNEQQVTKREVDEAKKELQVKVQYFHVKQVERQQLLQRLEIIEVEFAEQHVDLEHDYEKDQLELSQKVAVLRKNRETLKGKKVTNERLETAQETQKEKLKELQQLRNDRNSEWQTKQALYTHSISTIPEEIRELSDLQRKIKEKEQLSERLEDAWTRVQQQLNEAINAQTKLESRQQMEKQAVAEMEGKAINSKHTFEKRLKEQGFDSETMYQKVKLAIDRRKEIQHILQSYEQQLHTVKTTIEELMIATEGKQLVELDIIEQQVQQAKEQYEKALTVYNQMEAWKLAADDFYKQLEMSKSRIVSLEENFGKVTNLYDVIRGQNRLKISFERYIQIEYLERIIQAANIRLRELSNGQYELVRSDRQETRGRQSGLGIDVHDAYTGQTRDVKTLSGGEKFNASLCLALGMADVIQSFQGAVRMETMFIDEGFGALDEEAVQKAIDTLIALQQSGRMIGVISHIEEMKEAIPATLLVTKMKEGYSKTKLILS